MVKSIDGKAVENEVAIDSGLSFQERAVEGVTPQSVIDRCYDRYGFAEQFEIIVLNKNIR